MVAAILAKKLPQKPWIYVELHLKLRVAQEDDQETELSS